MSEFKLIALQPLEGCDERFLKNLEIKHLYKFYDEYIFLDRNGNEIKAGTESLQFIKRDKKTPERLYELESGLNVNISAIVGKNGSGKSTLLELYYAICFAIACKAEIIKTYRNELRPTTDEEDWLNFILKVYNELKVALYYLYKGKIYCLKALDSTFALSKYCKVNDRYEFEEEEGLRSIPQFENFLSKSFPYTIAINYSLYGLNSEFMGAWVKRLFHKNDGYQTPLVINPFRTEGNIDVNNELHLAQTRLLANIVKDQSNKEINGQIFSTMVYEKDDRKYSDSIDKPDYDKMFSDFKRANNLTDISFLKIVDDIVYNKKKTFKGLKILKSNLENEVDFLANYIFRKILKISRYPDYKTILLKKGDLPDYQYFLNFCRQLSSDRTHITFKLRQVLNMLRFDLVPKEWLPVVGGVSHKTYNKTEISAVSLNLEKLLNENSTLKIEELIPIGCYNVILKTKNSLLAGMSSGEQHFVHSIHSILYHILNVDSVSTNMKSKRIGYSYINIILDEIELYYHPEFQRKFVYELLKKLSGQKFNHIKGVNILFSTHSPFILSDIPKENILRLKNGRVEPFKESHQTLGANVHELLYNDFFLEESFMGEFIKRKIENLIEHLEGKDDPSNPEKKESIKGGLKWNEKNSKLFINQIGEPVLKDTLLKLYWKKYKMTSEMIDKEIERLQKMKRENDSN